MHKLNPQSVCKIQKQFLPARNDDFDANPLNLGKATGCAAHLTGHPMTARQKFPTGTRPPDPDPPS